MFDKNALSPQGKNLNSRSSQAIDKSQLNFKATLPFAAVTFCLLSSSQSALAADWNTQIKDVGFFQTNAEVFETDLNLEEHPNHNHNGDRASGLLPRILSLIAFPFKSHLANLSQPDSELNIINHDGMGGSLVKDLTPIFLSKAEEDFSRKFTVASQIQIEPIPAVAPSPEPELEIYTVRTGDTINRIAKQYGVSRQELISLNRINNSNLIFVNQKLKIPANQQKSEAITITAIDLPQNAIDNTTALNKVSDPLADARLGTNQISKLDLNSDRTTPISDAERLARLRADIDRMREELKQGKETEVVNSRGKEPAKLATSIDLEGSELDLFEGEEIALNLPPLPSSEEYLPETFDGYIWPAKGILTSGYGWRWGRLHKGIDIAAPVGTPIFAAASGKVVSAGWNSGGYGNLVKLQHIDGSITLYAHNHRILVNSGQKVTQGEQIAEMGNTGFSTGSHLHFEIHSKNKQVIDPLALLNRK